jgi:DNA-binding response OmpR family regulator
MLKRMLIVEDDENIRELLLAVFGDQPDYEIHYAVDGQEALQMVGTTGWDIILLDVDLPKLSGYSLCQLIKEDPIRKKVKVLMLSGLAQRDDRLKAWEKGADGYITKPFVASEVMTAVSDLLTFR